MTNKRKRKIASLYARHYTNISVCKKYMKYRKFGYDYCLSDNWGLYYSNAMKMYHIAIDREIFYAFIKYSNVS